MDDPMNVEVILTQPAKIDGKIVMPDGKMISVTLTVRDQLVAAGAVTGDTAKIVMGDAPIQFISPQDNERADKLFAQAKLLADEMVEGAVTGAVKEAEAAMQVKLDAAEEEQKALSTTLYEAENEVAALRKKCAALEAQISANPERDPEAAQNTPPSEKAAKPPQKGATAKKG